MVKVHKPDLSRLVFQSLPVSYSYSTLNKLNIPPLSRIRATALPSVLRLILCFALCCLGSVGGFPDQTAGGEDSAFSVDLVAGEMSEQSEDEGGMIRINADFDEKNKNEKGNPLADYQPDEKEGHRILAGDPNLMDGSLSVEGSGEGKWRLTFPEKVKVWRKTEGETFEVFSTAAGDRFRIVM